METKKKKKEKKKHKKIPQEFIENPTSDQHDSGKKRKHSSSKVEKIKDNTSKTKFKKIEHELTEEDAQANDFLWKEWTEKEIEEFESGNIDLETAKNQIDCSELPDALPFKRKPNEIIGENHESTLLIHQLVPRLTQLTGEDRKLLAKHDLVVQSGRFNQFENAILKRNWDLYLKDYNVPNPLMLFGFFKRNGEQNNPAKTYCYAFTHKTKLLLRLAKDLPHRTLYQIYCRARILLSGLKQARDFTDEDRKLILELHTKHGDRYATFCEEYGFNPKCAREVVRNAVKANGVQLKRGAWNSEELDKLKTNVLRIMKEENIISYSRIPWSKVAADMKRSDIQCRQRFFSKVFFKVMQDQNESKKWNEQYDIVRLIALMKRCGWADDALIDWDFIKEKFSIDCFNILSRSWSRVRLNVPDFQSKTLKEIVDYLYDTRVRKFAKKDPRAFEQIEKFVEDYERVTKLSTYLYRQKRCLARMVRSSAGIHIRQSKINKLDESIIDSCKDGDYLGIREVDDIAIVHGDYGYEQKKIQIQQLFVKYKHLLDLKKEQFPFKRSNTSFGTIRYDSENVPRFHGQFENIPQQESNVSNVLNHISKHRIQFRIEDNELVDSERIKFEEKQKFLPTVDENIPSVKSNSMQQTLTQSKINFRYAEEFSKTLKNTLKSNNKNTMKFKRETSSQNWIEHELSKRKNEPVKGAPSPVDDFSKMNDEELSEKMANVELVDQKQNEFEFITEPKVMTGLDYLKEIQEGKRVAHFQEEYDEIKKFINKKTSLDSKGFRILKNQIPDFSKMTNAEILDILERQVLLNNFDIVALNKPYGISIHGGGSESNGLSTTRVAARFNSILHLNYFLPDLANRLGVEKLYTVHRLDRDTTGVLLFAKTQSKAKELNRLFLEHRIVKRYLCITKNKPDIPEGIIDIPIELGYIQVGGKKRERMVLCPQSVEDIRAKRRPSYSARCAITRYRVIESNGNASLLEVMPETGIRHQIRVHLGFGLRCPILGDHKYSSLDTLAPQLLPADILTRLKVRQQKVRHIPMHLHSFQYMIPQIGNNGANVFIKAPLPYHFRKNMSSLKLSLDK